MKQLSIILLLAIFHMLPAHANGIDPLKPVRPVRILVTIGQWPGCIAFGLCGLVWYREGSNFGVPYADSPTDNILISEDMKNLEIQISRDRLLNSQPEKLDYLDGKSSVTITQSFEIPTEIKTALKAQKDLVIRPGTYPLTFIDGIFTIKFPY
ncbi:MAG TPA: hypothetical protein VMZ69_08860 [Saprospiraceae bacterium]|nr:hypothetical protein [Saprospiraceae bacterium]